MKRSNAVYIPKELWAARKQAEKESNNAKWGQDVPISKLLKHEIEAQLSFCETYLSLYKQFHSGNGFQPNYLTKAFTDNIPEMIQMRLDSLNMALKLKDQVYAKVAAGTKRARFEMKELAQQCLAKEIKQEEDPRVDLDCDVLDDTDLC